jgi:sulfate-transporting ATPase
VTAVEDVSFDVAPGEVLSIIGPNGAGKTSLMDGITGFSTMGGTVELGGQRIDSWPAHRRARAGLVRSFQTLELLEDMSVLDNLRVAEDKQDLRSYLLDLVHPRRGTLSPATEAAVRAFHLEDMLTAVPTDLAYGDRRLVAIARAVAGEPSVLLLDEPAAGLSETERAEVGDLIRMIADEWRIAVLLIEHDVALVRRVSDRVVALDFGRPVVSGSPDEVLSHPRVIEAYLGHADTSEPAADDGPLSPAVSPAVSRAAEGSQTPEAVR